MKYLKTYYPPELWHWRQFSKNALIWAFSWANILFTCIFVILHFTSSIAEKEIQQELTNFKRLCDGTAVCWWKLARLAVCLTLNKSIYLNVLSEIQIHNFHIYTYWIERALWEFKITFPEFWHPFSAFPLNYRCRGIFSRQFVEHFWIWNTSTKAHIRQRKRFEKGLHISFFINLHPMNRFLNPKAFVQCS